MVSRLLSSPPTTSGIWLKLTRLSRLQVCLINIGLITVLALPAIFSNNLLSEITFFGKTFMDLEDFAVSNLFLPIGSLLYVVFCTTRYGWGWNKYYEEVNTGEKGPRMPKWIRPYMTFVLPVIIVAVLIMSLI